MKITYEESAKLWTEANLATAQDIIRRSIERSARMNDAPDDPYVADELTDEATAQVWLFDPWLTGDVSAAADRDRDVATLSDADRVAIAAWRATQRVLSRHWLAGRPIDPQRLRAITTSVDVETLNRIAAWRDFSHEAYNGFWVTLQERWKAELTKLEQRVADRMTKGMTNRNDLANDLRVSTATIGRCIRHIRQVSEHAAEQYSSWRFAG